MISAVSYSTPRSGTQTSGPLDTILRFALRVASIYFLLDALPDLLIRFPGGPRVLVWYWEVWNPVLAWVGRNVLHAANPEGLRLPTTPVLLGDFAGGYVLMFLFLVIALILGSAWTLAAPHRPDNRALHTVLRVYLRYALALSALGYGISKLFRVQFRSLDLADWMMPLGMLSPRELLWSFMGFSRSYQIFTGLVECAGVALLLSRRTASFGALLLMGALGNVLMMDVGYGVSVRRIALRLLLMATALALPELWSLAKLYLLRRPIEPPDLGVSFGRTLWSRRVVGAGKTILVLYLLTSYSFRFREERKLVEYARPELHGLYKVIDVRRNGDPTSPGQTLGWSWVVIDGRSVAVQMVDANWKRYRAEFDEPAHMVKISGNRQPAIALSYARSGPDEVTLTGPVDSQPTEVRLQRVPDPQFALNDPTPLRWPSIW